MSLNAWLSAAKRHLKNSSASSSTSRRRSASNPGQALETELLEQRSLLTTLIINDANADTFTDAAGTLSITNADLGSHNGIVIEDLTLDPDSDGISINLTGVSLERLAIETVTINSFEDIGIDINLTNVTDTRTISIEDVTANGNSAGLEIDLNNTSVFALTVEDSSLSGVDVHLNGASSSVTHGLITENTIVAPAETAAIVLAVEDGGAADDFQIINNIEVTALNSDAILVQLTDAPADSLTIENNIIGNELGADVSFRAEGDTFVQPFELTNNATDGQLLESFEFDLRSLGLVFDPSVATGQPFNAVNGSGALTGATSVLSENNQVLTVNFTDFQPGETLEFVIDVDVAPLVLGDDPIDFSTFGRDLIGADVLFRFGAGTSSGPTSIAGSLIGDADVFNASQFVQGAGSASDSHGINLDLTNSPLTNASISSNTIIGIAGNGILVDADEQSDVSAVIQLNTISSSGQDGVHLGLIDSNFTGAILDNTIGGNSGYGVNIQPSISRKGDVESVVDGSPVVITSTNHQLQTGDQIILQGLVNDDPTINHPGNGLHTVTRIDNNRFSLQGVDGTPPEIVWGGGGQWYVPDIQADGSARGLVQVDLQATQPQGRVQNIQTISGAAQVTSLSHGLTTGDLVRISGAAGTGIGSTQSFTVTVLDEDNFTLDGLATVGPYDTSGGLATFTTNIVEDATSSGDVIITSTAHGLFTGDLVRVTGLTITEDGETLPSSANGRFTVTKLTEDTFQLQGAVANGVYTLGSGFWVPFEEEAFDGSDIAQAISGNSIDDNGLAGIFVNLTTGTQFNGDIVDNSVTANDAKGIHIESQSFGLGLNLPLDPNDPFALPDVRDVSFDVNIGTSSTDGNDISGNTEAGIVVEALNFATGSFEIRGNTINANVRDSNPDDPYEGDGIVVRLASDQRSAEATAFISESVIEDNQIGVDARGNEGNGLSFSITDRTRIQDLEVNNNFFLNSGLDGFHFERTEDGDLNTVIFEGNDVTNNAGDGFDVFAQNTVEDEIDFRIRNSNIDNNGEYGVRIDVQADARIDFDIAGTSIRENGAAGNGFNPNDGAGAAGQSGGIGIRGFQQVEVDVKLENVTIADNTGDGFSVDATNFFDSLHVEATIIDSSISGNSLTGLRSVGAAFGTYTWTRSDFIGNGTDGVRIISNVDTADFFNRRVGGQDIDVIALGNNFQLNGGNGAVLGMGVNAVFGNGDPTENFANEFGGTLDSAFQGIAAGTVAGNGEDGLKIVQEAGPFLRSLGRQRVIQSDGNVFTNNAGDGVDIGHDTSTEAGNVLHGDEVVSDVQVILSRADISDNGGDGVEYLGDSTFRVPPVTGGGQDNIANPNISSLTINQSFLSDNGGRGVDFLNRLSEDSRLNLRENEIIGNGLSGVYIVNTSSQVQVQNGPEDPLAVDFGTGTTLRTPNIEFRAQDNLIESNGTAERSSTVPINSSGAAGDASATANADFLHDTNLVGTTLGGIVIRVGTADQTQTFRQTVAATAAELGQSGIDAEIFRNSFDGNFGADVYFDNFVSAVPDQSGSFFDINTAPQYLWNVGGRDPLARFDLSFRENTGNSLDVINGFAFLDNDELLFKSRAANGAAFPNPDGPFGNIGRSRNATRTIGFSTNVGAFPDSQAFTFVPGGGFAYDGLGTPTWRIESDFDFNNFSQTSPIFGLSDFFDQVSLGGFGELPYQWDTGVDIPGFTGATPFSLGRGDIFNVLPGEEPIAPDQLEENDSFAGATVLVTDPITGDPAPLSGSLSVNSLTTDGILSIERKGDRDYYSFIAAGSGSLEVVLSATDLNGDNLQYLIYEVDESQATSEVPLVQAADGTPIFSNVAAGNSGLITVSVTAGRTYIIEVLSNEQANLGTSGGGTTAITGGTLFVYGTVRSYDLTVNAPIGPAPARIEAPTTPPAVTQASQSGSLARANVEGEDPRLESISQVTPDPTNTSVDSFTLTFSEDVSGVDLGDFQLTRDGVPLDISGAILDQINPEIYQISNLAGLTAPSGDYEFSLIVDGSNIRDTDTALLQTTGTEVEAWTADNSVNFFGDTTDNIPGDGSATDVNGNRSLRAAINEGNANSGIDIIELTAGTYTLSIDGRFEDLGLSGDLDIRDNLIIRGTGATASDTIIDGNQLDRVFHVFPGVQLTLENLTIQGGEAFDGAGIFVEGTSTLTGESASTGGSVNLLGVNLIDNEAYNQGGGIYNLGTLDIDQTSISRNVAGSRGGAIFNHGVVDLLNTTVSSNFAFSRGGGIYNETLSSAVNAEVAPVVTTSTFTAVNSTIALNSAEAEGGGLFDEVGVTSVLGNTIVDLNTAETGAQLVAPIDSLGFNYIGASGVAQDKAALGLISTDFLSGVDGAAVDAGLAALTNVTANGTFAHIPNPDAFVVDQGSNLVFATAAGITNSQEALVQAVDQLGSQRLIEADADGVFQVDIGAVELFLSQPVAVVTATPNPAGAGETVTFDASASTHTLGLASRSIVNYEWDFDFDGTTFTVDDSGTSATTTNVYPSTGTFVVALRVTDDTGAIDLTTIVITVSAPNQPVITGPLSAGTSDSTPLITWTGGSGQFNLVVINTDTNEVVINETGITDLFFQTSEPLPPGNYSAVVTAVNFSGESASEIHLFSIERIALTNPLNFDQEFDTTPEITFTQIPDAVRYQVWISQLDPITGQGIGILLNDDSITADSVNLPGTDLAAFEVPFALDEGLYRVWVRAIDANDNTGDWSTGSTFNVVRPTVTGPGVGTTINNTIDDTPTITFTDVGANQYQVWITQLSGVDLAGNVLTAPQLVVNAIATSTSFVSPELGDGEFQVFVRALADDGEEGLFSDAFNFRKDLRLSPILQSPIGNANVTDRTPVFEFEAVEGAAFYDIWVNLVGGQTQIIRVQDIPHVDGVDTISFTDESTLLFTGVYRWWVRAFNDDGVATSWGRSEQFFVPVPINTTPDDDALVLTTNLPRFEWTGVPEYETYEIWVNNLDSGQTRVINIAGIPDTFFQPEQPLENASFRWWVRGTDAEGNISQWSSPTDFTINSSIDNAPVGISPILTETDNTPVFEFVGLPNATEYELIVRNLTLRGQPNVFQAVVTPTAVGGGNFEFELSQNLVPATYRWWVRGVNADGTTGPFSQPLDFNLLANADQLETDPSVLLAKFNPETVSNSTERFDSLHSITVHPMAVVAAHDETAITTESVVAEIDSQIDLPSIELADNSAKAETAVDAIMEELSMADWLMNQDADAITEAAAEVAADAVVMNSESQNPNSTVAAVAGLAMLGGKSVKRNRRNEDQN
ncbi:MAG: PKD domain-containing protein [Fuerstiella sp.]